MPKLNFSSKQIENAKLIALTAFIMGIITHGEMIFYKISMHDDIGLFFSSVGIPQGRWAGMEYDRLVRRLFGAKYSTPVFAGLVSILFIAICVWLLVDMLEIKKRTNIILITSLMVTFPAVAHTFMYMICAPLFFCALFFCAFSAWLTTKFKFGWIYSIPLIAISLGMYQAYLSYFFAVLLLLGTKKALESLSEFRKLAISGLLASGGGVAVYCVVLKLYEAKYNSQASYMGMDHMMEPNILGRMLSIKKCYADYILILRNNYPGLQTTVFMCWMYRILVVCMVVNLALYVLKKRQNNLLSVVLSFLSFALIPIGTNALHILGTEKTNVGLLTMYPMVISLITIPTVFDWKSGGEDVPNDSETFYKRMPKTILLFATYASAFFICLNYVYMTNATYLRLSFLQEKLISYQTTLVTRIKSSEGYKDEYPVIWAGEYNIKDLSTRESAAWEKIKLGYAGGDWTAWMINNYAWKAFMNEHVGYNPEIAPIDDVPSEIKNEIAEMPCYPDDGSIKVIDEYVVVKLGDPDEVVGKE